MQQHTYITLTWLCSCLQCSLHSGLFFITDVSEHLTMEGLVGKKKKHFRLKTTDYTTIGRCPSINEEDQEYCSGLNFFCGFEWIFSLLLVQSKPDLISYKVAEIVRTEAFLFITPGK